MGIEKCIELDVAVEPVHVPLLFNYSPGYSATNLIPHAHVSLSVLDQ